MIVLLPLCEYSLFRASLKANIRQYSDESIQMKTCRDCNHIVSEQAFSCPGCGAPYPARENWDGWGFEYKSKIMLFGLPLVHISFKYRPPRTPVPAKGIIAIGQFAIGIITVSQFGIGIISISQFTAAVFAVAQFALAWSLIAQMGLYFHSGYGQFIRKLLD
jgi:hypothetical protein